SVESTGYVVNTLQAALWSFTQGDDFESVILRAVNLGGDADTIAAVAGQIAGATWGLSAIPPRWTQRIYSGERILKLAMDLFMAGRTNAFSQESVKDWYV
ncbi:ADP-ribosylglycohydrolase family protein, partial [Acidiphilium sp. PM]|uniref:ADP-ribosylglycohydrolase family protein n=2 Tax=unclassified Acidiphilium TaxID=2617493 RepID=UPI0002144A03